MMMEKLRYYRILTYITMSFVILIIFYNLRAFAFFKKDNLVSLFYVRKDNITGEIKGEIYPIALFTNGKYIDASVGVIGENTKQLTKGKSYLNNIRNFIIIEEERKSGEFEINEIKPDSFMCSEM